MKEIMLKHLSELKESLDRLNSLTHTNKHQERVKMIHESEIKKTQETIDKLSE